MTRRILATALSAAITGVTIAAVAALPTPAQAFIVFDPSNYSQNILTAARTLQQINNQIRMLQNQAQSLINQAKNLTTISFPELEAINQTLQQINQLMAEAQGIQFHVAGLNQQFQTLYPTSFNAALTSDQHVIAARSRMATAMSAYQQTMTVQAGVIESAEADEDSLAAIVARSQSAQGALQVGQATNQLLALIAKQQFQLEHLMAAQFRADTYQQAGRVQAQTDAQGAITKFLGSGTAYSAP